MGYNLKKIGFCYREPLHSHGSYGNDKVILDMVQEKIRDYGYEASVIDLTNPRNLEFDKYLLVFSMCRSLDNLSILAKRKKKGPVFVNEPLSTIMTLRENLYKVFKKLKLYIPRTSSISIENEQYDFDFPFWMKRKDYHHIFSEDVVLVRNNDEYEKAKSYFRSIGYRKVFIQDHIIGKKIKFYGIYSRISKEIIFFKTAQSISKEMEDLIKQIVLTIQKRVSIEVFGGDVIIDKSSVYIVDFNSWPSFKACPEEGAQAIADYGMSLIKYRCSD